LSALLRACELQSGAIWGVDASDYWSSLILALFATGERFSAVCSSRWQDFDSASKTLSIVASATKTKCGRVYKLTDQATTAIELMRFPPRELIWPWPHCRRYRWTVLRRIFEAAGLFCEGERQLAHSIRRSTISYAAAVDLEMARRQAGHYSASLTLSAYVDPRIASLSQAADVLPTI
jgi:integrase